ncbi:VanZ family protein [Streptomyces sp. DSM 15324]|uniref:VanZ family protein n=1 Tax=Streptomyces sp. DSM 15324 TaxID=1739111 RepID=UPI000A4E6662
MARAASRPRPVFRLRPPKGEQPPDASAPAAPAAPRKKAALWRRVVSRTKAAPGRTSASGKKAAPGRKAARKEKAPARSGPRPMPFPLRLLAMLFAFAFMVGFAVVLARLTLEPSPASEALVHSNLHPGRSLRAYLDQPALRDAVKQIGGNVLLGVPFGILVPVLAPKARGMLRVLVLTASVMLLVEFAQGALITGRAFDIDDVILNTTGALVGYLLLGRRMSRAVHAPRPRRRAS